jgi:2-phospho-L-lactate/phosphoenolpyruvate guanylyltransferase
VMSVPECDRKAVGATSWSVVIPVKLLSTAKTRLQGFDPADREALALAMALDTIAAVLACDRVEQVLVVTDEQRAAVAARELGAHVVADQPNAGLNAAIEHGAEDARRRRPHDGVAAIAGDLPATQSGELARVLDAAAKAPRAALADADGDGTVVLTAAPTVALSPAYGEGSLRRHQEDGAVVLDIDAPGLRRDVDTVDDLREALRQGCGPQTSAAAARLGVRIDG